MKMTSPSSDQVGYHTRPMRPEWDAWDAAQHLFGQNLRVLGRLGRYQKAIWSEYARWERATKETSEHARATPCQWRSTDRKGMRPEYGTHTFGHEAS
jgi:hypothetical protein